MNQKFRQTRIRDNLVLRAGVIDAIRSFFKSNGYLEVETPIRIPAPAPEAHIDAEPSGSWYLQTSPELCMKQLLAAGYGRIFQICKCFRSRERGRRHLPEMTLLEWYTAEADYDHMMNQCEALIRSVAFERIGGLQLSYQGRNIDLSAPWQRLTVAEAFERYGALSVAEALEKRRFDEIMGVEIEPRLGMDRPVFLYEYPAQCGALARLKPDQPDVAERFELYIGGLELCNGFSELNDHVEQRSRFATEMIQRREAGKASGPMPENFLDALSTMPPATGNALGIDRLTMLLTDAGNIDEVVAFCPEEL
ncbi:MAG: EF-P lysine aminoacylase EpmA [Desulfobacteraceae bacterium]